MAGEMLRGRILIYFVLKSLILWARSEMDGSALGFCV